MRILQRHRGQGYRNILNWGESQELNGIGGRFVKADESMVGKIKRLKEFAGRDMDEWPENLRIRQHPEAEGGYMRDVKTEQNVRLDEISALIDCLEEEKRNIYDRSLHGPDSEKVCEDWIAGSLSEEVKSLGPIDVQDIVPGKSKAMEPPPGRRAPAGSFVAIRPCAEECEGRTFLGMMLGDLATGVGLRYSKEIGVLEVAFSCHNPAIWVFELNRIVLGCGSWWGLIKSEEHLRKITNEDIDNVGYVKALKAMGEEKDAS